MSRNLRLTEEEYAEICARRKPFRTVQQKLEVLQRRAGRIRPKMPTRIFKSTLEDRMAEQIALASLRPPVRQHQPIGGRKIRMDFAWPELHVGLEVQGMVHRIKGRWKAESERRALLLLAGWSVLEVNGDDVRSGRALEWLVQLLKQKGATP